MSRSPTLFSRTLVAVLTVLASCGVCAESARADWLPNGNPVPALRPVWSDGAALRISTAPDDAGGLYVAVGNGLFNSTLTRIDGAGRTPTGWPTRYSRWIPFAPGILPDGQNGAFVLSNVYACEHSCGSFVSAPLVANHLTATGASSPGWPDWLPISTDDARSLGYQEIHDAVSIANGAGGLLTTWTHPYGPTLQIQRVDADGSTPWGSGGVTIRSVSTRRFRQSLACDGCGGAYVVWTDPRDAGVYAQHVTADGQAVWATDGIPVTPEPSTVLGRPVIVSDGSGGAIVAWAGTLGARSGVFATVLAPSGETAGHDEIAVFAGSGVDDLRMVGMRNGGALLAWRVRDPAGDRILVQRLDREARLRHRAPVTACAAPGTRNHLALSADSRGGAYVAWSDDRPDFAIFATHLDENGAIAAGWPADGAPVAARRSGAAASIAVADVQLTSLGDVLPERGHTFGIRRGDLAPPARGRDGGAFLTWATDPNSCPRCEEQGPFVFVTRLDPAGPVVAPVLVATPDAEQNASLPVTSPRSAERPLRACSAGNDRIALSLPSSSPASLELFDLAGRRIWSREVESGAGAHTVRVGDGVPSGVYLARLRQGQATATARLAIVR